MQQCYVKSSPVAASGPILLPRGRRALVVNIVARWSNKRSQVDTHLRAVGQAAQGPVPCVTSTERSLRYLANADW